MDELCKRSNDCFCNEPVFLSIKAFYIPLEWNEQGTNGRLGYSGSNISVYSLRAGRNRYERFAEVFLMYSHGRRFTGCAAVISPEI